MPAPAFKQKTQQPEAVTIGKGAIRAIKSSRPGFQPIITVTLPFFFVPTVLLASSRLHLRQELQNVSLALTQCASWGCLDTRDSTPFFLSKIKPGD